MFLRGACSRPSSASFVSPALHPPTGKTDILSDWNQTYTLVIHKTVWITQWITTLFDVRRFLITPQSVQNAPNCYPAFTRSMQGFAPRLCALQTVEFVEILSVVHRIARCLLTTITYVYELMTVNLGGRLSASSLKENDEKKPAGEQVYFFWQAVKPLEPRPIHHSRHCRHCWRTASCSERSRSKTPRSQVASFMLLRAISPTWRSASLEPSASA